MPLPAQWMRAALTSDAAATACAAAGTVFEALLAWAVMPTLGWRWLLALSALPLLLLLALYPLLPESPHWLVAQGRYAEAEALLLRVAKINGHHAPLPLRAAPGSNQPAATAAAGVVGSLPLHPSGSGMGPSDSGSLTAASVRGRSPAPTASPPYAPLLAVGRPPGSEQQMPAGGGSLDGGPDAKPAAGPAAPPLQRHASRHRLRDAWRTVRAGLSVVYGRQLRRTTLLLYCIWSVNAVTYYGLVLLTTALQTSRKKEHECTPSGAPNLDRGDYVVGGSGVGWRLEG